MISPLRHQIITPDELFADARYLDKAERLIEVDRTSITD